jgi:hypothetical protein
MKVFILLCFLLGLLFTFTGGKPFGENHNESPRGNVQAEAVDLLRRLTRQASNPNPAIPANAKLPCKYRKGSWSSCDPQTKVRTRTLTLKKGDATCEATKTMHKECKGGKKGGKQRNSTKNRPNKNNANNNRARNSSASN